MTKEKMELMRIYNNRRRIAADCLFQLAEAYMKGEIPGEAICELIADTALQLREDYEDVKVIMYDGMKEPAPMWCGSWKY